MLLKLRIWYFRRSGFVMGTGFQVTRARILSYALAFILTKKTFYVCVFFLQMLFEMDGYEGDLDYRSIAVSTKTPCKDVIPLIVKKYDLPGKPDDYQLMEVSEDNEGKINYSKQTGKLADRGVETTNKHATERKTRWK